VKTPIWLTYRDLYPNEVDLNIDDLLCDIPSIAVLQLIAFINSQIYRLEIERQPIVELWRIYLEFLSSSDMEDVRKRVLKFKYTLYNCEIYYFSYLTSLTLAQKVISNFNNNTRIELTKEEYFRVLKAYFKSNEFQDQKINTVFAETNIKKDWSTIDLFLHTHMLVQVAQHSIMYNNNIEIQLFKAIKLFTFWEADEKLSQYLQGFCNNLGFDNWRDFIRGFISVYMSLVSIKKDSKQVAHRIIIDSAFKNISKFMDESSIDYTISKLENKNDSTTMDFLIFRNKPLFKVSPNEYCVLYLKYFEDIVFQALLYQFHDYIKKNGYDKQFPDFKSQYSFEFIEKQLFYDIMNRVFLNKECIKVNGNKYPEIEYSDYYIRDCNNIFLFELKDCVIDSQTKYSYDFETIFGFLKEKFIITKKKKKKAIKQLLDVIHNIENSVIEFDNIHHNCKQINNINVYPIIVFTDIALNSKGINYLLKKEMNLMTKDEKFKIKVKDLIMIDLNTLVEYQDLFRTRINLLDLCIDYLKYVNSKELYLEKWNELTSFSEYFNLYIQKLQIENIPYSTLDNALKELQRT
jgi:hypothetical protein